MEYGRIIYVDKTEVDEFEQILSITEGVCPDYDHDAVIKRYSATFENGFSCDIKVCNGETPYVDAVLFDEQGCEVNVLDVSETLVGEYSFAFEKDTYKVLIEAVTFYPEKIKAISLFSGDLVEVIGETTVVHEGKVLEQYLYNIIGYEAKNGQPFVSLKANIVMRQIE